MAFVTAAIASLVGCKPTAHAKLTDPPVPASDGLPPVGRMRPDIAPDAYEPACPIGRVRALEWHRPFKVVRAYVDGHDVTNYADEADDVEGWANCLEWKGYPATPPPPVTRPDGSRVPLSERVNREPAAGDADRLWVPYFTSPAHDVGDERFGTWAEFPRYRNRHVRVPGVVTYVVRPRSDDAAMAAARASAAEQMRAFDDAIKHATGGG
jgi:hypothetical protein